MVSDSLKHPNHIDKIVTDLTALCLSCDWRICWWKLALKHSFWETGLEAQVSKVLDVDLNSHNVAIFMLDLCCHFVINLRRTQPCVFCTGNHYITLSIALFHLTLIQISSMLFVNTYRQQLSQLPVNLCVILMLLHACMAEIWNHLALVHSSASSAGNPRW